MIPPLRGDRDEDRQRVAVHAGAPTTASTRKARVAASCTRDRGPHQLPRATTVDQPAGDPARADQPDGVDAEGDAVPDLGEADDVLVDERRRRDVGHHHREREREHRDRAAVGAVAHHGRGSPPAYERRRASGARAGASPAAPAGRRRSIAAHRPATVQSIPRQPTGPASRPPTSGASTGATPPTVSIRVNALAAARPVTRSAMTARPITMPPAPAKPCTSRAADEHRQGRARARRPRRRPRRPRRWRSAGAAGRSGPRAAPSPAGRTASPTRNVVSVSWTPLGVGAEVVAHRREPGQVEVGRDRCDRGQRREDDQQRPAGSAVAASRRGGCGHRWSQTAARRERGTSVRACQ